METAVTVGNRILKQVYDHHCQHCGLQFCPIPALRTGLLKYCKPHVNATETFLKRNLRDANEFQLANAVAAGVPLGKLNGRNYPDDYSLLDEAFAKRNRAVLLGMLCSMLHFHVYTHHQQVHGLNRDPTDRDGRDLAVANTLGGHAVRTITHNFQQSLLLACRRARDDWEDLETLYFEGQNAALPPAQRFTLVKLNRIKLSGSEVHKEGRQLLFLRFRMIPDAAVAAPGRLARLVRGAQQNNVINNNASVFGTVVYKPSDLEFDTRLVGDTQILLNRLPHRVHAAAPGAAPGVQDTALPNLAGGSLFELLNGIAIPPAPPPAAPPAAPGAPPIAPAPAVPAGAPPALANPGLAPGDPRPLPTYRIFPRKPGSLRPDNQISDSYGYIEFLSSNPERTSRAGGADGQDDLPAAEWDWIAGAMNQWQREVGHYYRTWGWYSAIALIFGLADAHEGNFVVHRRVPYLIDLEASGSKAINSLAATCMEKVYDNGAETLDAKCLIYGHTLADGNFRTTVRTAAVNHVIPAMYQALFFFRTNYPAIDAWLQDGHLARTIVRFVPRSTRDYGDMINAMMAQGSQEAIPATPAGQQLPAAWFNDPAGVTAANPTGLKLMFRALLMDPATGDYKRWYDSPDQLPLVGANQIQATFTYPVYALASPPHDFRSVLNCDYPSYYRRLGSRDLLNAYGVAVNVAAPPTAVALAAAWPPGAPALPARVPAGAQFFDQDPDPRRLFTVGPLVGVVPRNGIDLMRHQLSRLDPAVDAAAHAVPPGAAPGVVAGAAPVPATTLLAELRETVRTAVQHYLSWHNEDGNGGYDPCPRAF